MQNSPIISPAQVNNLENDFDSQPIWLRLRGRGGKIIRVSEKGSVSLSFKTSFLARQEPGERSYVGHVPRMNGKKQDA